jgi:hypothetical protein
MSNGPMSSRLLAQPSPAGAAAEPRSDAQRIAAALERIEAAIRREPATIAELRADLAEVVETVAALRAAVDAAGQRYTAVGALVQDLERRMLRMTLLLGPARDAGEALSSGTQPQGRPADEQAFLDAMGAGTPHAETDRVPTVSEVVSQLGRSGDAAAAKPEQAAGSATAVAMLEAMVEELAAAIPETRPAAGAADDGGAEDGAAAPPPDFMQLDEMPYFPAELGTAVIFDARPEPDAPVPQPEPARAAEPDVEPGETEEVTADSDLDALLFEPSHVENDPAAFLLDASPADARQPATPQEGAAPSQAVTKAPEASIGGHEPPIDPPEPPAAWDIDLPMPANARRQGEPQAAWHVEPPAPATAPAVLPHRPGIAAAAAPDPLAALNSMSDEEKIALFE